MIPELPGIWDEPFADTSQIAVLLVSRLARTEVTVSLSGDGGDELFAGYNRHAYLERLWGHAAAHARPGPPCAGIRPGARPPGPWSTGPAASCPAALPGADAVDQGGEAGQGAGGLRPRGRLPRPRLALGRPRVAGARRAAPASLAARPADWPELPSVTEQMLWLDLVGYLPDDILTKVDRAAMATSLETRVPFLDRSVFDLAWRLPMDVKLRDGVTKWVLRQVLYRHVPRALVDRPKMGFGLPIGPWLRGPLRPWAEELLVRAATGRPGSPRPGAGPAGVGPAPRGSARPGPRAVGRHRAAGLDRPLDARLRRLTQRRPSAGSVSRGAVCARNRRRTRS